MCFNDGNVIRKVAILDIEMTTFLEILTFLYENFHVMFTGKSAVFGNIIFVKIHCIVCSYRVSQP